MDRIRAGLAAIPTPLPSTDASAVARGIMTTDTVAKTATASVADATIVGVAKGVGMIEPNMATMITMIFTDAAISSPDLGRVFRSVVDRTFNCVSVDTDTSTSDTAVVLASGAAGPVDVAEFEAALFDVCASLAQQIARDGEGATKLIEVIVDDAASAEQAKRVAKAIVNSPLVKTAVHGADPNWGRVAMAVGKSTSDDEVRQDDVVIRFGVQEVYPARLGEDGLATLAEYMRGADVRIHVSLATGGSAAATVWGCDLSDGYVRINADYTT
jgi:glutamate N-acetyltransferase/amino-acid N-acetyltransferase